MTRVFMWSITMKKALLLLVCSAGLVAAQEPKPFPEIIDAKKAFDKEKVELDHRYGEEITKARARYVERLTDIRIKAVTAGNVDLAQDALFRAREVEKELRAFQPPEAADPPAKPAPPTKFAIIAARWGAEDRWDDVTAALRSKVAADRLVIAKVENAGFHDPNFGKMKTLVIVYSVQGKINVQTFFYSSRVVLP